MLEKILEVVLVLVLREKFLAAAVTFSDCFSERCVARSRCCFLRFIVVFVFVNGGGGSAGGRGSVAIVIFKRQEGASRAVRDH